MAFKFKLQQRVTVPNSDIQGVVIRRSEGVAEPDTYQLRFLRADGKGVEAWFPESDMLAANPLMPAPGKGR